MKMLHWKKYTKISTLLLRNYSSQISETQQDSILRQLNDPNYRIAIVGRPNTGKSTLFNKIIGYRASITHPTEHTTRDVQEKRAAWRNKIFKINHVVTLLDTPGTPTEMESILGQVKSAIDTADMALFVTNYQEGIMEEDQRIAQILLNNGKKLGVIHVMNKCDHIEKWPEEEFEIWNREHFEGLGTPLFLSAERSINLGALQKHIELATLHNQESREKLDSIRIALVGRTNVGKSTLLNSLVGSQRVTVSDRPGTTRDSIEVHTEYEYFNPMTEEKETKIITIIDTAGIEKKSEDSIEHESFKESFRSIRFANVVIQVFDAQKGITKEDLRLARTLEKQGRGIVFAANKWDTISDHDEVIDDLQTVLTGSFAQLKNVPVVVTSALHGVNTKQLIQQCIKVHESWNKEISKEELADFWSNYTTVNHIPMKWPEIRHLEQTSSRPPTFSANIKRTDTVTQIQERTIKNAIAKEFGLGGIPIRLKFNKNSQ